MAPALSPDTIHLCRTLARQQYQRAPLPARQSFDLDDLVQEALLAAWLLRRRRPDAPESHVVVTVRGRMIDFLRRANPAGDPRKPDTLPPVQLDVALHDRQTDEYPDDPQVALARHLLAAYPGDPVHAELAWREARGEDRVSVARGLELRRTDVRPALDAFRNWAREEVGRALPDRHPAPRRAA